MSLEKNLFFNIINYIVKLKCFLKNKMLLKNLEFFFKIKILTNLVKFNEFRKIFKEKFIFLDLLNIFKKFNIL